MVTFFVDIETDNSKDLGLDPYRSEIVTFQIMTGSKNPLVIQDIEGIKKYKDRLESSLVVGHNIKFECKFLKHHLGITLKNVYDTMVAEHVLTCGASGLTSLKSLVLKYCGINLDKGMQTSFAKGKELSQAQVEYAVQDILYLPEIMNQQMAKIKLLGLENILDIEMKCIPAVAWMELSGMNIDLNLLKEIEERVRKENEDKIKKLSEKFCVKEATTQQTLTGDEIQNKINIKSSTQLLKALQSKGYNLESTGKKAFLKYKGDPLITEIEQFRATEKLLSSFIDPILGTGKTGESFVNPVTGRVHANFNQCGALSGRFSCEDPNLQQQPSKADKKWREIYKASKGCKIVAADYSQEELRIIGQLSGDPGYIKAYKENLDLHKQTAATMFNTPLEMVTKTQRTMAKSINFGLNYGMGAESLKSKLKEDAGVDVTVDEAERLKKAFQRMYPKVTSYLHDAGERGFETGFVDTLAGRKCNTKAMPKNKQLEEYTIRNRGKNLPVQGLGADILKTAMGNLFLVLEPKGVKLINAVHDELVFECKAEDAEEVAATVKAEMERVESLYLTALPSQCDVTIADYWKKD
ncbi:DNA polymerase [Methanosarcina sp.]|uniref:DNA polymerase n=1 Tax=Methanosarcina sp. TaxID=2213 RepID=UPI002C828BA2|nr:DNA polymerase [Methanosarcina sp.]HOW15052.1 DNA polymerase [Methanosarcina sp.]